MKLSNLASALHASLTCEDSDYTGLSIDTRTLQPGNVYLALRGERFDGHDFVEAAQKAGAVLAIVSEEGTYSLPVIRVSDTRKALIELAVAHRKNFKLPVIAITGSCGKTTVRALSASIFSQCGRTLASQSSFNNDIGVPLTMLRLSAQDQYLVQEMGANHPGEIAQLTHILRPTVVVITCAAPVHLEGFGSLDGVACAKGEIYQGLGSDGIAILNQDDHYADFWRKRIGSHRTISFGLKDSADVRAQDIHLNEHAQASFKLSIAGNSVPVQLQLIGEHNVMNALAAAAIAHACQVPLSTIKQGLESAEAEKMRLQAQPGIKSTQIIDDSYNANPTAMLAALKVLSHHSSPRVFVVGDMRELGENAEHYHEELGRQAAQHHVDALYCFGPLSQGAAQSFGKAGFWFDDLDKLINQLQQDLQPSSTVLVKGSRSMGMDRVVKALQEK